eukprot:CAMPEP_0184080056 /NCGR_PEP_ID=MMETSP0974-20121125/2002_1 /TAXON_ID=483370 /ORGANISM="non described non described, Strain CCMP2097" /LENGTH=86 /DNA_ID=CAMNT_0026382705 /DNA_START=506 /DNA_END=764 /DNA_ORIENTATION=-
MRLKVAASEQAPKESAAIHAQKAASMDRALDGPGRERQNSPAAGPSLGPHVLADAGLETRRGRGLRALWTGAACTSSRSKAVVVAQ